ncbi:RNA 3'-terminal phosphate cyclase [Lignipirellula cremea]|uniref:RNA 3'-terminal phosphate cyclase n=1 Tax=Lignipirellula cremea TaxID=2528010 RepID=A0A518DLQ4_9BACT|nr:RNA 3'-terminal phosphate cyclase [Lignipirellula cremea]QDU92753.1 RNA 3'-terminal phosphate cyclase [Lignipirellula cremea]
MITIDGAEGEGGGQVLRSALTLSLVTGEPFTIQNIRARRKSPGLKRQHLAAVQAAARVGAAEVEGDSLESMRLQFRPAVLSGGHYDLRIHGAGSTSLVLQTLLPALLFADAPATVLMEGGTHNPWAPPFDYLTRAYLPLLARMGARISGELLQYGFFPAGGGACQFHVEPCRQLRGIELLETGPLLNRRFTAVVANLPLHIAERECDTFARKSGWPVRCFQCETVTARGPGNVAMAELDYELTPQLFIQFGKQGVKAEHVASNLWREVQRYQNQEAPISDYQADQLLLPLGLAAWKGGGPGLFRTGSLTEHSRTHIEVLQRFLPIAITAEEDGKNQIVRVEAAR